MDKKQEIREIQEAASNIAKLAGIWACVDSTKMGLKETLLIETASKYNIAGAKPHLYNNAFFESMRRRNVLGISSAAEVARWFISFQEQIIENRITAKTRAKIFIGALAKNPCVTVEQVAVNCSVSIDTARRWLKGLVFHGHASCVTLGNTDFFFTRELVEIICKLADSVQNADIQSGRWIEVASREMSRPIKLARSPIASTYEFQARDKKARRFSLSISSG